MKKKRYSGYPTVIAILLIGLLLASTPKIWRTSQKGHKIDEAQPSNILTGHEIDQPTQKKITPVAPLPSTVVCNCPQPDYQETPQIKQEKVRYTAGVSLNELRRLMLVSLLPKNLKQQVS